MKNSLDSQPQELERLPLSSHLKRWGRWVAGVLCVFWLLVFVLWGALHVFIVPRIDAYRSQLQNQATQALGMVVRVGEIRARGGWLVPWFEVQELRLYDAEGREALRLPRVMAAVSPLSLLRGKLEQLVIDQPQLNIRRDTEHRLWVAGVEVKTASGEGSSASDWFFSQPEFVIHQGQVTWTDETRTQAPTLALQDVDVVIQNGWAHHHFDVKATPPASLSSPVVLQAKLKQGWLARAADFSTWQGEVFADLPHMDLKALRQWVSMDKTLSVQEGLGALRVWADVTQGRCTGVVVDVALQTVDVRLEADLLPLRLHHVSGRVGARWSADEVELSSQDLVFDTDDGEHWPGGLLRMSWRESDGGEGTLQAEHLDLNALAQMGRRLPLSSSVREMLARVQPRGQVSQLHATWHVLQHGEQSKLNYTARGTVKQLSWQKDVQPDSPLFALPGVEGANIDFDVNQQSGKANLEVHQGSVTLPLGLEDPNVLLDDASIQFSWRLKDEDHLSVQVNQGRLSNADASGEFSGSWHMGEGDARLPGVLDLTVNLSRAKAARVHRYLPDTLPQEVRHYVAQAVKEGDASQVKLRLRGDLNDMPFNDPKRGEFRVSAQLAHGVYAYVPESKSKPENTWPALTEVNGELVFERSAMRFKGSTQLVGAPHVTWQNVQATIPNLAQTVVQVTGEAKGPLPEVLTVVQTSAINDLMGKVLDKSQASAEAEYKLSLNLPIDALTATQVQGEVKFANNDLQIIPGTPVINRAQGVLRFSHKGFDLTDVRGQLLGGDARLSGGLSFTQSNGVSPIQLKIEGEATADGLRQAKELGFISRLAQQAKGKSRYAFELGLLGGQPQWQVRSDLDGMALTLPAPLNKPQTAKVALRVESQLTPESLRPKSKVWQDQIKVSFGKQLSVMYVRDLSSARARVVRGVMTVGNVTELPARDGAVNLAVQLPWVDLDAWNTVLNQAAGTTLVRVKTRATPQSIGLEASGDGAQDYLPNVLNIKADQLKVSDRLVHKVTATGSRTGDLWRLNVNADELNGAIEVRPPNGNTPAQLYARLAYLVIPPSMVQDVESLLSEEPSSIPALDIVVQDLTLRNKKLGRLEIEAINRPGTQATREWRLNKFNASMPEAVLTATGNWAADGKRTRRTQFKFSLDIKDAGQLLTRLGTPDALKEGAGRLAGEVSWRGSPITPDYASMSGRMNLNIEKGRFLKAEPGAARLLGVLNLQALPRRLTLDFDDMFSEGFAFDFVRGDVQIEHGIANSNNLQMKGVVAGALIEGHADLANETQDLKVVVVPEINAGTASLYMATINPVIGLTSYLAQTILSKPLVKASTTEFHVDGTWTNPRVVKVEP